MFDGELIPWHGANVYSNNVPLRKPGVYMILNLINAKKYIGISQNVLGRVNGHVNGRCYAPVLEKAFAKYGVDKFAIIPLLYSLEGTEELPFLETMLIIEFGSLNHGYNVQAASGAVGPYGEKFSAVLREAYARPETREKLLAANARRWADPIQREKMQAAMLAGLMRPDVKEKRIASLRKTMADAEFRARRSAIIKERCTAEGEFRDKMCERLKEIANRPDVRKKASERMLARTPEQRAATGRKVSAAKSTPEFRKKFGDTMREVFARPGQQEKQRQAALKVFSNPEVGRKIAASRRGSIWITDGTSNRSIHLETTSIPVGWYRGRARK